MCVLLLAWGGECIVVDFCTFFLGVPSYHRRRGREHSKNPGESLCACCYSHTFLPHDGVLWQPSLPGGLFFSFLFTSLSTLPEGEVKTRCCDVTLRGKWTKGQLDAQEATRKENQRKLAPSLGPSQVESPSCQLSLT